MKIIYFLLSIMTVSHLFAAETDNFSYRNVVIPDVSETINEKANYFLTSSLNKLNSTDNCNDSLESESRLYKELKKAFANHTKGEFTKYLLHDENLEKKDLALDHSVYKGWTIKNGLVLAYLSPHLSPLLRVGEEVVGTDKFEHMFGMGFIYFRKHYLQSWPIEKVLKMGIKRERYILGGLSLATGVFSYGDLSANFNGLRFWNHMLQKRDDPLGSEYNIGPYVACVDNKWKQVKEIDFRSYIDASMDESINCSNFASHSALRKFQKNLQDLDSAITCPSDSNLNLLMQAKYKELSPLLINEGSNRVISQLKF